ncbi:MAG TPA: sterol desaturase family protein [Stellaceae bacterium]|nr:sterol desaturase family protein [Stellaceae bacterium]
MIETVQRWIEQAQGTIFEQLLQPALFHLGLMDWSEDVFDGVEFALYGALAVALAYVFCRPLEWWRPVERWSERRAVRTDIVYTLIHRIGIVPAILFLALAPIGVAIDSYFRFRGYIPPEIEQLATPLSSHPFATFLVYMAVLDLGEYWRHRLQHRLGWWWALHSLHHDQRQMTLWSDDRNHILDDVLAMAWSGTLAMLIGVPPGEYPLVLIGFRLVESLAHTNVRLGFGRLGGMLLVGPQYHRIHHAIEHATPPFDRARGCNFASILPLWDMLFGTWRPAPGHPAPGYPATGYPATGVAALAGAAVRCGYLRHQWEGLRRLAAALGRVVDRRRPGFVAAFPAQQG